VFRKRSYTFKKEKEKEKEKELSYARRRRRRRRRRWVRDEARLPMAAAQLACTSCCGDSISLTSKARILVPSILTLTCSA